MRTRMAAQHLRLQVTRPLIQRPGGGRPPQIVGRPLLLRSVAGTPLAYQLLSDSLMAQGSPTRMVVSGISVSLSTNSLDTQNSCIYNHYERRGIDGAQRRV